jgi:hypothetical protein
MKKIKFPKGKGRLLGIFLFSSRARQAASAFRGGSTSSSRKATVKGQLFIPEKQQSLRKGLK